MAVFYLAKQGYGSVNDIKEWDTTQFLDAIEYESINNAIERYTHHKAEQK
jgi:hypothetical protein